MQTLFETWRFHTNKRLLTEKLLLKPGPKGWDLYGELVARAYERAPTYDQAAASAFSSLAPFVENMFKKIQSKVV